MAKLSAQATKLGWKLLGRNLGRGGQGDVELVERVDGADGKRYALKALSERGGAKAHERFRKELAAIQKVNHNGIVKVVDFSQADGDFQYYVMEYHEGADSLRHRMDQNTNPFICAPLKAIDGFIQLAEALAACEAAGIVHRDLSPANVLVTEDGKVMLIDFGLCYIEDGNRVTLTDEAVGTPHYRPPECSGHSSVPISIKADLYSAGKLLWSMVTNKPAFDRERPVFNEQSLAKVLPDDTMTWHFHHIFERTIRFKPEDRFPNASDALAAAKRVRRLIVEGFKPLEALADGMCPVCGVGRLQQGGHPRYGDEYGKFARRLGDASWNCWICPYCFHAAFIVNDAQKRFSADRKKLEEPAKPVCRRGNLLDGSVPTEQDCSYLTRGSPREQDAGPIPSPLAFDSSQRERCQACRSCCSST